jgi:outer membrane protein OmpA-like peptidoglycan-associated protein
MKIRITLIIILSFFSLTSAQIGDIRKADKYFEKTNYKDASLIYSEIIENKGETLDLLKKTGDCFYFSLDMEKATLYYEKLITNYKEGLDPEYIFRYAQSLKATNNANSDQWFKEYYKNNTAFKFEEKKQVLSDIRSKGERFTIKNLEINTNESEFGAVEFNNNIVFSAPKSRLLSKKYEWNKQAYLDLFSVSNDSLLGTITPFSEALNTKLHEATVSFSSDNKTIYFTRNNYHDGKKNSDDDKVNHLQIYRAQLVNDKWVNETPMPFNGISYSVEHPSLSRDGKTLYFSSDMPGSLGSFDIFSVDVNANGTYGEPKNLGPTINTEHREQFPYISKEGDLYFASDGHLGFGLLDIFKSVEKNGSFDEPLNVGIPINSERDDFSFVINDSTRLGYFASNRKEGKGADDIYSFKQIKKLEDQHYILGTVVDITTQKPIIEATIKVLNKNGIVITEFISKTIDGTFKIAVDTNETYTIETTKENYIPSTNSITIRNTDKPNHNMIIEMTPKEKDTDLIIVKNNRKVFNLKPIYFDFDKWNVRNDSKKELDILISELNKYPKITLLIESHTDSRGTDSYNKNLSSKRAKSTLNYLVEKGINKNRLKSKGFGESNPVIRCISTRKCSENEHQKNRRSEFVIINYDLTED